MLFGDTGSASELSFLSFDLGRHAVETQHCVMCANARVASSCTTTLVSPMADKKSARNQPMPLTCCRGLRHSREGHPLIFPSKQRIQVGGDEFGVRRQNGVCLGDAQIGSSLCRASYGTCSDKK
eukprot:6209122-Pleurochrysis_carterae.AAC.5